MYPQSTFWRKKKKNRYTHANLSFTIKKWGLKEYSIHGHVMLMSSFSGGNIGARPLGPKEIDVLLVPPGKAFTLLIGYLITVWVLRSDSIQEKGTSKQ